MVGQSLTVPPPSDDDHEDVAWALRAASAQWRRDDRQDAIAWVRRAAETAIEVGQAIRARELFILAQQLEHGPLQSSFGIGASSAPPHIVIPAARLAVAPPMRAPAVGLPALTTDDADLEFEDAVGLDDDAEIVFDDEVETVEPVSASTIPTRGAVSLPSAFPSSVPARAVSRSATPAAAARDLTPASRIPSYPASVPPNPWASSRSSRPPASSQPASNRAPSLPPLPSLPSLPSHLRDSSGPPSSRSRGFDTAFLDSLDDDAPRAPSGEPALEFADEPPTRQAQPSMVEMPTRARHVTPSLPIDGSTAAEYAQRHRGYPLETPEQIEHELGVDLSLGTTRPPAQEQRALSRDLSPTPGRASVRPARTSSLVPSVRGVEPFLMAPSASLPPVHVDFPVRPSHAPPPESMTEPEPHDSHAPEPDIDLTGQVGRNRSSLPPPMLPPADDDDDILAGAFERLQSRPPTTGVQPSKAPAAPTTAPPTGRKPAQSPHQLDGVELFDVRGLQDLPEDAMAELAQRARLVALSPGEEVASFGVALVTAGSVLLMPTVADAACARARRGEVVFTRGTIPSSVALRVVGAEPGTRVAVLSDADLDAVTSTCPWVRDELAEVGDRYNAFGGAVLGPLGESLDEMFRTMVLEKCVVKNPAPGSLIAHRRKSMDGMYVLGCGTLLVLSEDGRVESELSPGDFVFPETVLGGSPARADVRVAKGGALLLYAGRMAAHELLATCPPFIEILAG